MRTLCEWLPRSPCWREDSSHAPGRFVAHAPDNGEFDRRSNMRRAIRRITPSGLFELSFDHKQARTHHLFAAMFERRADSTTSVMPSFVSRLKFCVAGARRWRTRTTRLFRKRRRADLKLCARRNAFGLGYRTQDLHRMPFQRETHGLVIGGDVFRERHDRKFCIRLRGQLAASAAAKSGSGSSSGKRRTAHMASRRSSPIERNASASARRRIGRLNRCARTARSSILA